MSIRPLAGLLVAIFTAVTLFGLPLTAAHMGHETGCPLMPGEEVLCEAAIFLHLNHWQMAFAAFITEMLLLLALAILYVRPELFKLPDRSYRGAPTERRGLKRPTTLEELFSRGILNPKAP